MQKRTKYLAVAGTIVLAVILINVWSAHRYAAWRKQRAADIIASYRREAVIGAVPQVAADADAIRCFSVCYDSLPDRLKVRSAAGDTYFFVAEHDTRAAERASRWRFRFVSGTDADGRAITNRPGI
jgi:hypothetical protein